MVIPFAPVMAPLHLGADVLSEEDLLHMAGVKKALESDEPIPVLRLGLAGLTKLALGAEGVEGEKCSALGDGAMIGGIQVLVEVRQSDPRQVGPERLQEIQDAEPLRREDGEVDVDADAGDALHRRGSPQHFHLAGTDGRTGAKLTQDTCPDPRVKESFLEIVPHLIPKCLIGHVGHIRRVQALDVVPGPGHDVQSRSSGQISQHGGIRTDGAGREVYQRPPARVPVSEKFTRSHIGFVQQHIVLALVRVFNQDRIEVPAYPAFHQVRPGGILRRFEQGR